MDENFRSGTKTSSEHRQFSPFKLVYFVSGVVLILALPTAIFCVLEGWTKVFSEFNMNITDVTSHSTFLA